MREKINSYLGEIIKEENTYGIDEYYHKLEETIVSKFGKDNHFVIRVLDFIDREVARTKNDLKLTINNKQKSKIAEYLENIYTDTYHPLNKIVTKAVNEKLINFGFVDDIMPYYLLKTLIEKIIKSFHILKLYEIDNKLLLKAKRDKKKILNAIDIIEKYTTNKHLQYELQVEKDSITIVNKTILYSSFFCDFTYSIKNLFKHSNEKISNSKIEKLSKEIMFYIFEVNKDYRITKHIKSIMYKNYVLYRYNDNKISDKRRVFYKNFYSKQ